MKKSSTNWESTKQHSMNWDQTDIEIRNFSIGACRRRVLIFDTEVFGRIIRQRTDNRSIEGICIYKQFLLVASTTTTSTKPLGIMQDKRLQYKPQTQNPSLNPKPCPLELFILHDPMSLIDHFQSVCLPPIYLTQAEKNVSISPIEVKVLTRCQGIYQNSKEYIAPQGTKSHLCHGRFL